MVFVGLFGWSDRWLSLVDSWVVGGFVGLVAKATSSGIHCKNQEPQNHDMARHADTNQYWETYESMNE